MLRYVGEPEVTGDQGIDENSRRGCQEEKVAVDGAFGAKEEEGIRLSISL